MKPLLDNHKAVLLKNNNIKDFISYKTPLN
jgi:hypothetical protein